MEHQGHIICSIKSFAATQNLVRLSQNNELIVARLEGKYVTDRYPKKYILFKSEKTGIEFEAELCLDKSSISHVLRRNVN